MRRFATLTAACLLVLSTASLAVGAGKNPKPGPMTGTWECTSHGGPQGDMPFTLTLEQAKEDVTGSVSSPMGGTEISSGTYKNKTVEIHINTPQGNYLLTGKVKKNQASGQWSTDTGEKGTWEGKKAAPAAKP